MQFTFVVEVEVAREQGKFASREDVAQEIQDTLERANPDSITVGDDSEYSIDDWSVEELEQLGTKEAKQKALQRAVAPELYALLDEARELFGPGHIEGSTVGLEWYRRTLAALAKAGRKGTKRKPDEQYEAGEGDIAQRLLRNDP